MRGVVLGCSGGGMSWVDTVLEEWGVWLRTKGCGQGWGGAVDLDRLFEIASDIRAPGSHSDPTLAEILATEHDDQAPLQRVNFHILQCKPPVRLAARLRYAGMMLRVPEPGPRVRSRWVVESEVPMEGCGRWLYASGHWEHWGESGAMPVVAVAGLMETDEAAVHGLLGALHKKIRAELLQDARARKPSANSNPRRLRA